MTDISQDRRSSQTKVWLALSALVVILALVFVPPFVSVRRYKNRITEVISSSVGRPVRLSSVELRIIPRPSFVITDLTVEEDPAYGAEPVLHANTVTASIRLLPLFWRARLEISRISVDEASLNLVRTAAGGWNIDAFFRTAAARAQSGPGAAAMPFPYLEATDSRVNIKNGVEKLPYSLVNADLSFWQENPGDWRVRLKGQPARTDVSLDLADTGIVRLEGRLRRTPELYHSPIHLDVDWRDAQLGQLSRLVLGDDQGWRGDLRGEIHVDGTADAAQVTARLRAAGVHRREFAPASPIDFDAACSFVYHYADRGLQKLLCDSPVGNGRARLTGELPGGAPPPRLTLELDRVPAQLALDTLRTVRSGIDPSLQAEGTISGRMTYAPPELPGNVPPAVPAKPAGKNAKTHAPPEGPLSGSIAIAALRISDDSLSRAMFVPRVTMEPAPGQPAALVAVLPIPAGAPGPLNVTARLTLNTYQVGIRGAAALARLRELARVAGFADTSALEKLEGPPAAVDLTASGPWLRSPAPSTQDFVSGSLTLHGATWKPDFLAGPVELSNAVLHFDGSGGNWDPVAFSYGPVHGGASLYTAAGCTTGDACSPHFNLDFSSLDAATLQAAILGARNPGTLLSGLLNRLRPSSSPGWPQLDGTVRANALVLGPVTLENVEASLALQADAAEIRALDAALLGGRMHAEGKVLPGDKPDYKLKAQFDGLNASDLGSLLGMNWSGSPIGGSGEIELVGFSDRDLAASARGSLHFDWRHGSVVDNGDEETPPTLAKFDRWSADAEIRDGAISLKQNQVQHGSRKTAVEGSATFGNPPHVMFASPADGRTANGQAKR